MIKRWLIVLMPVGFLGSEAFVCVPSPETPASVIEYFKAFNKPLPQQFCAKEDVDPQASELSPPERRGHSARLGPRYLPVPPTDGEWPRNFPFQPPHSGFEWF